jgi:hypothetical protein
MIDLELCNSLKMNAIKLWPVFDLEQKPNHDEIFYSS